MLKKRVTGLDNVFYILFDIKTNHGIGQKIYDNEHGKNM